jgi:hypothetical protein
MRSMVKGRPVVRDDNPAPSPDSPESTRPARWGPPAFRA